MIILNHKMYLGGGGLTSPVLTLNSLGIIKQYIADNYIPNSSSNTKVSVDNTNGDYTFETHDSTFNITTPTKQQTTTIGSSGIIIDSEDGELEINDNNILTILHSKALSVKDSDGNIVHLRISTDDTNASLIINKIPADTTNESESIKIIATQDYVKSAIAAIASYDDTAF